MSEELEDAIRWQSYNHIRPCDTIGCRENAIALFGIAPGTNVWLCEKCLYLETKGLSSEPKIEGGSNGEN